MPRPTRTRTSLPGHARAVKRRDAQDDAVMEDAPGPSAQLEDVKLVEDEDEAPVVRPPTKVKKADKAYAKREALIAKITAGQNPYSKSHTRRVKRAAKPKNNLIAKLTEVEDVLPELPAHPEASMDVELVPGTGGKGKEKLTAKKRQRVLTAETARLPAVLSNPAFATNPFETIRLHTLNTLQTASNPKPKQGKAKK